MRTIIDQRGRQVTVRPGDYSLLLRRPLFTHRLPSDLEVQAAAIVRSGRSVKVCRSAGWKATVTTLLTVAGAALAVGSSTDNGLLYLTYTVCLLAGGLMLTMGPAHYQLATRLLPGEVVRGRTPRRSVKLWMQAVEAVKLMRSAHGDDAIRHMHFDLQELHHVLMQLADAEDELDRVSDPLTDATDYDQFEARHLVDRLADQAGIRVGLLGIESLTATNLLDAAATR